MSCKEPHIQYSQRGHDFPASVRYEDTNNYFYPYKDSGTTKDSFGYAVEYRFYKAMDEENLRIRPCRESIFSLNYEVGWSIRLLLH